MTNLTEKMIAAITDIAETNAEIWDVFDICDKHELSSGEETIVIAMYGESKGEMIKQLQPKKVVHVKSTAPRVYSNGFGADENTGVSYKELNKFTSIGDKNRALYELGMR